jgi:sarcosine oxidase subunit gamma
VTAEGVTVSEPAFPAQVDLRVSAEDARGRLALPFEPNTRLGSPDHVDILWLGPDEWLSVGPPGSEASIVADLERRLSGVHHSVVDVSANRAVVEMLGSRRLEVLAAGCGIDLHPRAWTIGSVAQTLLARVPVILTEEVGSTRVFVRPSFAGYLVDWLRHQSADLT